MAITSKLYFVGTVPQGKIDIKDIPVFGFETGQSVTNRWPSAGVDTREGLKNLTMVINPQVPVHFAMPRTTATSLFPVGQKYEKVILEAFKPNSSGYMVGAPILIVFSNVSVKLHSQNSDFPVPAGVQARYFQTDKKMGREFLIGTSVKLLAQKAEVVPS